MPIFKPVALAIVAAFVLGGLTGAAMPTRIKAPIGPDLRGRYTVRLEPTLSFSSPERDLARSARARTQASEPDASPSVFEATLPVTASPSDRPEPILAHARHVLSAPNPPVPLSTRSR